MTVRNARNLYAAPDWMKLVPGARAHYDRAGIDPDPHRHFRVCRLLIESRHLLKDTQAGPRGSFRIIFVGFGPAEMSHNAIAQVFGAVAAITGDRLGRG